MSTSKTSETYKSLKNSLLNGRFAPGEQLRIDSIRKSMDVSIGAVREALSRLTSDGLVQNTPQRGFIAAPISVDDLRDLTNIRIEAEVRCLQLAIERGDLGWEGKILSAYHQLSRTGLKSAEDNTVSTTWTELHAEFHDSLIAACGSPWRLKLRDMMFLQAERYRRMAAPYVFDHRDVDAEHRAIMEATLDRDAPRACALLSSHFETTLEIVLKSGFLDGQGATRKQRKLAVA
ncbi:GntR family transcriptional regulator [Bradyrhizobium sp. Pha-3]|uniref:GntR family transcriptional regulator n=1 Tax=Bradyrhizobium sp. Pha-3 TaxID=208375 RepID=UPI0035D46BF5